jgi:hypothetical protein
LIENRFRQITVGIDHAHAVAVLQVLKNQIPKECRLSRATFADAVNMLPAVSSTEAERNRLPPSLSVTDEIGRFTPVIHFKVIARHSRASPRSAETALETLRRMPDNHCRTRMAANVTVDEPPR